MNNLIEKSKLLSAITPTAGAAAATAITGTTIDTFGFRGILFLLNFGTIVSGAVTSFKVQHGDASDNSDMADVLGSAQTVADTADDTPFYCDINRVTKRYARLVVSRATQNATLGATALLYDAVSQPVTQTASGELSNNPVSGTA